MKLSPTFGNNIYLEEGTNRILNQQFSIGDTYSGGTIFYTEFNKVYVYRLATLSGDSTWKWETETERLIGTLPDWGMGENNTNIIKAASTYVWDGNLPIPNEITFCLNHPSYSGWWVPSKDEAWVIYYNMLDLTNPNMDEILDIFPDGGQCATSSDKNDPNPYGTMLILSPPPGDPYIPHFTEWATAHASRGWYVIKSFTI